ncbi:MAG: hypothetical protein AAF563_16620 [Pseudomonadota bacterium]
MAVIVHTAEHVRLVVEITGTARPLVLTAPGAQAYAGVAYLWTMTAPARDDGLDVHIDCGDDAGFAMAAIRTGWRHILMSGDKAMLDKIDDMITQLGGTLNRSRPPAIDLGETDDPRTALKGLIPP